MVMAVREGSGVESQGAGAYQRGVYLDYNATTPLSEPVASAMSLYLAPGLGGRFGNPASGHAWGVEAKSGLEAAREGVRSLVAPADSSSGGDKYRVVFTSGGTESNCWCLLGAARAARRADAQRAHVVTSVAEHPAVVEPIRVLESQGFDVTWLGVGPDGRVDPEAVSAAVRPGKTCLVSVMHANNEVGAVSDWPAISRRVRAVDPGVFLHTDASQSVGKVRCEIQSLGVDGLTVAGHKLYAPKGVGALVLREAAPVLPDPFLLGGGQEMGQRAGTENVAYCVALGAACDDVVARGGADAVAADLEALRGALHASLSDRLAEALPDLAWKVNGPVDADARLPNTLSISFQGVASGDILARMAAHGVFASGGSACHSGLATPSATLAAMGLSPDFSLGTLRLSVGRYTTKEDVFFAAKTVVDALVEAHG